MADAAVSERLTGTLREQFLPVYDVCDEIAVVVDADPEAVWEALNEADFLETGRRAPLAGALGAVRMLPEVIRDLLHGERPPKMPDRLRVRDFSEPAYAKTVYSLAVEPLEDGRSLLRGTMRTATTDERARRWFRRYSTFGGVGSGAHVLVGAVLDIEREDAERRVTA